jgi:preprotein translocase subunit YajC
MKKYLRRRMMTEILIFGERITAFGAGIPGMPGAPEGADAPPAGGLETGIGTPAQYQERTLQPEGEAPSMLPFLLLWGAVFVGMYFLMIRPQRKREKKMRELQAAITMNDNVVTSGGLFGKVADVGEDCFIVEFGTNRGIRIPVLKADVVAVRSPKMTPQAKDSVE